MSWSPEAYTLLTIPNATLTTPSSTFTGALILEYVTFAAASPSPTSRDVLLVLRISTFELVLDPGRTLTLSVLPSGEHRYIIHSTPQEPAELLLTLPASDDIDLFHSVLAEYGEFRGDFASVASAGADTKGPVDEKAEEIDLRGRFVLVNEDNGEIIGALDNNVRVREDPSLREKGEEDAPVVVELPEGADTLAELNEMEVIVRTVPQEDRDWMLKGAVFVSHVISGGTTLLTSAMSSASSYYIAHSTPSPHATPSGTLTPEKGVTSSPSSRPGSPLPPPSRTLLLLQSPSTRKNLTRIHAVSGHAVKLSSKTAAVVENMIERVISSDKGKGKASPVPPSRTSLLPPGGDKPPLPPRSGSVSPAPPYSDKPPLPPRKSPLGSPSPSRSASPLPPPADSAASPKPKPLRARARIALSAALILSSLSASSVRLADVGGSALSAAVAHKYGAQAGENVGIAAGAARNVVLVYVDVRGLGRRAIVKRVAKGWVKGQASKYRHGEK